MKIKDLLKIEGRPVVTIGPKLENMISIRDIVETQLEQSKAQVRYLTDYISGGYV